MKNIEASICISPIIGYTMISINRTASCADTHLSKRTSVKAKAICMRINPIVIHTIPFLNFHTSSSVFEENISRKLIIRKNIVAII